MKNRQYHGVQLSKKESELVQFLMTGSNLYEEAFFIYKHRKGRKTYQSNTRRITSWFNRTLKRLHAKRLCLNVPFIWHGVKWINPGIEASKANLVIEEKQEVVREIQTQKPIL